MLIAILGGLGASIFWASTDILVKKSVEKMNSSLSLFLIRLGTVICALPLLFFDKTKLDLTVEVVLMVIILGFVNLIVSLLLLFAFKNGKVSFITPTVSTYTLLSALASYFLFGEEFGIEKILLVVFVYVGIVLTGMEIVRKSKQGEKSALQERMGLMAAFIVMLIYSIYFPVFDSFVDRDGWGILIIVSSTYVVILVLPLLLKDWSKVRKTPKNVLWIGFLAGILNGIGNIAFSLGFVFSEDTTVTVAIASSTSAVAVLFAYIFLKERMRAVQYWGVGIIVLGLVLSVLV